jgi:hypothetical protein
MNEINFNLVVPSSATNMKSRSQAFAMRQVVAVPAAQGGVAGISEKKLQRRRFNVAVAKYHTLALP